MKKTIALAVLLTSQASQAGVITYSDSFGVQGSTTEVTVGELNESLRVSGFDSSLGTLTGVSVRVSSQLESGGYTENLSPQASWGMVALTLFESWQVSSSLFTHIFQQRSFNSFYYNESASKSSGNYFTLNQGDRLNFGYSSGELSQLFSFTGAELASFNTQALDFNFNARISSEVRQEIESGEALFESQYGTGIWGKVEVTYEYASQVWEPASILLMGVGIIGMAAHRRRQH